LSIYDTITGCYDYQCNVVFAGSTGNCGVYFSHHALSNYLLQSFQAYSYYNVAGSSYLWDFGDGTTSTQSNPTHLYSQAGIYNVCLTFTDVNNCTSSFCYDIYVFNTNCSLNYSFSNTTAAPLTYNFSSSFVSPNAIYIWNYGDGSSDTTSSPTTTYTYTTTGTYHSCLTIYDVASGCLSNVCQAIYAGSVNGNCGNYLYAYNDTLSYLTYNFIGVSYSGNTASTYLWDFGDGNTSTAATPTHTYTQAGEYTVCLTLTDNAGCVSTSCQIVYVYNWYCTTDFTVTGDTSNLLQYTFAVTNPSPTAMYYWDFGDGNIDTTSGATVTYTYAYAGVYYAYLTTYDLGTGCYNYNDAFVFAGSPNNCGVYYYNIPDHYNPLINTFYAYSYTGLPLSSCVWDFGDGNTSTSLSPTHTYSQNGYYYVCLTATDTSGCVATYCQHIYIYSTNNTSCSANFSATSDSSIAFTYNFAATTSITFPTYYWDFGDGSTIISNSNFISHTYQNSGTYYVCVNVYDNLTGCNVAYCGTIYVSATVNNCQADILYSNPQNLNTIDFSVFHTGAAPLNYHWDFGDGYTSTLPNPTHTYSTNGNILSVYYVTVIVSDINGCIAYGSTTVAIYPANNGSIISGVVAKDTSLQFVADAIVYLIQYDSINGTLTAVDTTQTVQGFYEFLNVPAGSYLVKAVLLPTDPNYANYLPTYYVQSLAWTAAQYITASPMSFAYSHDIVLVKGTNNGGAGFISGMVVNGAGRPIIGNQTVIEDIMTLEPMVDMSVLLLDESNGAITHTVTHTDGSYSFSNLGMGAYKVHVEECGKVTFPAEVTIDPNNMNHTNVHFTVHDNMVTLTMVYRAITNIETFNVFPNPVQENLTLELGLKEGMNFNLTVTNLIGQDIISENKQLEKGNHLFQMNLKDLPTGLYLLSLTSGTDVVTYKIFKQ
jgi:PKD repeat protein